MGLAALGQTLEGWRLSHGGFVTAAEAVLTLTPDGAADIEAALAGTGDAALLPFAVDADEAALAQLGQ